MFLFFLSTALDPLVQCPSQTFASTTETITLPAPDVAGFSGPVSFSYSQSSSFPIEFVTNSALPYHEITASDFITPLPRNIVVTATDGIDSGECEVTVIPFVDQGK